VGKDHPMYADVLFNKRPEQLDIAAFIELTNRVEQALKD
jgi:16S rRNA (adenine1518-N6/adenine1519-N6)-dimethyltransferase